MAVEDCLLHPNRCILIIGPTLKQAVEIVAPRMRAICEDAPSGLVRRAKAESKWYIGDSEIVIGGFDVTSSSQRGKTVQNIYIEEIVESNEDDFLTSMRSDLGPALTHSKGGKMIFLTTLPKVPDHPFIIDTMVEAQMNNAFYKYTIDDNKMLTPEQYEACVRRAGGRHTVDFLREYMCELVRDGSLVVVPPFNEALHTQKGLGIPSGIRHQLTVDFGGVRDKTVALLHAYDFDRDCDLVYREIVFGANTPTKDIVDRFKEELITAKDKHHVCDDFRIIADLQGQTAIDLAAAHSFPVGRPAKTDWQGNVNRMVSRFAQNKIKIDSSCSFLIQSLRSGTLNRSKTDFERTIALGHCDALAALMYSIGSKDTYNPFKGDTPYINGRYVPQRVETQFAGKQATNFHKIFGFKPKRFL